MDPATYLLAAVVFTLVGVGAGVVTGLIPGLHVNNWAAAVVALQGVLVAAAATAFGWADPTADQLLVIVACLVVGNAISHTFIDFIPSVLLGAPEPETALSVLPGHRMLLRGKGYEAIRLSAYGSLYAVFLSLLLLLPIRMILGSPGFAYEKIRPVIYLVLLLVAALLILTEGRRRSAPGKTYLEASGPDAVLYVGEEGHVPPEPTATEGVVAERIGPRHYVLLVDDQEVDVRFGEPTEIPFGTRVRIAGEMRPVSGYAVVWRPKALALGVFLLSGALGLVLLGVPGLVTWNLYLIPGYSGDATTVLLFPLFTGLFGIATLLLSTLTEPVIPEQEAEAGPMEMEGWRKVRAVSTATLAGGFVGIFPGVSGASATVLAKLAAGGEPEGAAGTEEAEREFMVSLGGVNTAAALFSVMSLFVILRVRSGAAAAVDAVASPAIHPWEPLWNVPMAAAVIAVSILVASLVAYPLTLILGRVFSRNIRRIPYKKLILGVMAFLLVMVAVLAGALGLAILATATAIGLLPPLLGVKRVHLMGSLILPMILLLG
jgi:putative membrane protein